MCNEDPERIAHARESAKKGTFKVVIKHDDEKIGTLDKTFHNMFDADRAARDAEIEDVGITTEIVTKERRSESEHNRQAPDQLL